MRHSRRLTNSRADAEDLLQETLMHAYIGFHTFAQGTNLNAWLFRILHNRWANTHRRSARRPMEVSAEVLGDWDTLHLQANESAEAEALRYIPDSALRAALLSLPDGVREVLYYRISGYTYEETAALMGVPRGTVMSRSWRARERLRGLLSPGE